MTTKIDPDLCTGCELCTTIAPDVYQMDGDIAKVISSEVPAGQEDAVNEAIDSCPGTAITAS